MDEKMQYADMLEIPVNTCTITNAPIKKRRFFKKKKVDSEQVKAKLMDKINSETQTNQQDLTEQTPDTEIQTSTVSTAKPKFFKGRFKFSMVTVQVLIIGVLLATIFITNSVYPNSALNVFMRGVLGSDQSAQVDTREFSDFAPVISVGDGNVALSDGIMTITGGGSVYSACDGKVTSLTMGEDGKYVMQITHSQNFASVVTGLDYAYSQVGDTVYSNIPVGYVEDEVSMCFTGSAGAVLDNFTIENNNVIWSV